MRRARSTEPDIGVPAEPARIGREEFARRRRQLIKAMGREAIAIIPAAPVHLRNNDVEHAYRQDSNFFYLTGFAEPESVAVLVPGRPQGEYLLFVRDRDPARGSTAHRCGLTGGLLTQTETKYPSLGQVRYFEFPLVFGGFQSVSCPTS